MYYYLILCIFRLVSFLESRLEQETDRTALVVQSLACARLLQGILGLCPNFQKSCTFNCINNEWTEICSNFNRSNLKLWRNWIKTCNLQIEKLLDKMEHKDMLEILPVGIILSKKNLFLPYFIVEMGNNRNSRTSR